MRLLPMHERRAYIRVPAGVEAQFQIIKDVVAPRLALTRDISLSGMRFTPTEKLDPGAKVSVTLFLPKEGQVNLRGVVVWTQEVHGDREGYDVGLRWADVSPVAQARLNSFLTDRTKSKMPVSESLRFERIPPAVHWGRVGLYTAIVFILLLITWSLWVAQVEMQSRINSLQTSIQLQGILQSIPS